MNWLHRDREFAIVRCLAEGMGIRATERTVCAHRDTVTKTLVRRGRQCCRFLDRTMHGLLPEHWQIDEMWTYIRKKEKNLTPEDAETGLFGDHYLFLAIGETSKLVPCFLASKRDE